MATHLGAQIVQAMHSLAAEHGKGKAKGALGGSYVFESRPSATTGRMPMAHGNRP